MEKVVIIILLVVVASTAGCLFNQPPSINNFIHPFVLSLSDIIVDNVEEAAKWVRNNIKNPSKVKNKKDVYNAIGYYKKKYLNKDDHVKSVTKNAGKK